MNYLYSRLSSSYCFCAIWQNTTVFQYTIKYRSFLESTLIRYDLTWNIWSKLCFLYLLKNIYSEDLDIDLIISMHPNPLDKAHIGEKKNEIIRSIRSTEYTPPLPLTHMIFFSVIWNWIFVQKNIKTKVKLFQLHWFKQTCTGTYF